MFWTVIMALAAAPLLTLATYLAASAVMSAPRLPSVAAAVVFTLLVGSAIAWSSTQSISLLIVLGLISGGVISTAAVAAAVIQQVRTRGVR